MTNRVYVISYSNWIEVWSPTCVSNHAELVRVLLVREVLADLPPRYIIVNLLMTIIRSTLNYKYLGNA